MQYYRGDKVLHNGVVKRVRRNTRVVNGDKWVVLNDRMMARPESLILVRRSLRSVLAVFALNRRA